MTGICSCMVAPFFCPSASHVGHISHAEPIITHPHKRNQSRASHQYVIDRYMYQLDDVADGAHDDEADADLERRRESAACLRGQRTCARLTSLRDLDEFALVGLLAAVEELGALLEEVPVAAH